MVNINTIVGSMLVLIAIIFVLTIVSLTIGWAKALIAFTIAIGFTAVVVGGIFLLLKGLENGQE